jgi:hypothetical protein
MLNKMLNDMTRAQIIQVWFAAIALVVVAAVAFGAEMKVGTGAMLLTLSLVPPFIVFLRWPRPESVTTRGVLRGTDRRL